MVTTEDIKDNKLALVLNLLITLIVLSWKNGGTISSFYGALGESLIYLPLAYVVFGIIAIAIFTAIRSITSPDNKIEFSIIDRANFSIFCLWVIAVFY